MVSYAPPGKITNADLEKIVAEEFNWWFYLQCYENWSSAPEFEIAAGKIWNAWLTSKGDPQEIFADKVELPPRTAPIIIEVE
jgi:hypothetical protein